MGLGADTTSFGSSGGGEGTHVTADLGASTSGGVVALRISLRRRGAWRGRGNARVRWWRGGVAAGRVFVLRRGHLCHGRRGHGGKRQRWPFGWNGSSVGLGADEETRQRRRVATAERVVGRQREHRGRHGHCDREHGGGSPNFVEPWQRRGIVGALLVGGWERSGVVGVTAEVSTLQSSATSGAVFALNPGALVRALRRRERGRRFDFRVTSKLLVYFFYSQRKWTEISSR